MMLACPRRSATTLAGTLATSKRVAQIVESKVRRQAGGPQNGLERAGGQVAFVDGVARGVGEH